MFDLPLPIQPSPRPMGPGTNGGTVASDPSLPFALTRMHRTPAALMSGTAAPVVVERFATLADAMQGAFELAEGSGSDAAPQLLAILDYDQRLVLAGAASDCAVAWCHPVTSAAEARGVVTEASQLRAQAGRAATWGEPDLAAQLRHRADLLDARLVDPLWRAFAAWALQVAA
ncbi:DNA repair protein RadC [Hoeflea sp.]|uniref:DNA repair protein RadC n=1 Tax=Hoeflea sp. TaxID=1940281 RepID=UPI0025C11A9E|nr:DNA repair protein RadC [Hoeflea sp.]MBU4530805.1 DNA repair protein RadC [Alphaproteobacteria bacterium]MBU4542935.1 DNA repair protein RadC [Alphaproteobacteria bacterium]MBU4549778.1 DNA repair protein RadC [Alphaproteobacteria bacterium]MBV1783643.1 DNA repair protein RadC [Hoeflea sp.]